MSLTRAADRHTYESPSPRERIRCHMKMVIAQLDGILKELKDVAKELREVVGQIDKLTSDFDFDVDPDDWTVATASSTSSSERGLGEAFRPDPLHPDVLSDSWEFCSYLEAAGATAGAGPGPGDPRPWPGHGSGPTQTPGSPPNPAAPVYSQMNGGLPVPNGPRVLTPDSSSEEAGSSTHSHRAGRASGPRERVRFSDKILYHALCCDDDQEEEEEQEATRADPEEDRSGRSSPDSDGQASPPASAVTARRSRSEHSLHHPHVLDPSCAAAAARAPGGAHTLPRKGLLNPGCRKKLLRNSSTQTVSDKSTQTVLPYVSPKQKPKDP